MAHLENFSFETPKLLVFCLGGHTENGNIEVHDVVFFVAQTDEEATKKMQKAWFGTPRSLHVDTWLAVDCIDGYRVLVSKERPGEGPPYLYFVNLGFYIGKQIGEHHFMTLVVAKSKKEAMKAAMGQCSSDLEMLHLDDVHDLDGCVRIDEVDQYYVHLELAAAKVEQMQPVNGYQNLRKKYAS